MRKKQDIYLDEILQIKQFRVISDGIIQVFDLSKSGKEISKCFDEIWYRCGKYPEKTEQLRRCSFLKPQGGAWLETSNEIRDKKYKLTKIY